MQLLFAKVQLITYMMDKHGEDWSAMARDPKNHYQETAAKLRGMVSGFLTTSQLSWIFWLPTSLCKYSCDKLQVTKFISIPEHYAVYCRERGLIQASEKPEERDAVEEEDMDNDVEEEKDEELESDSADEGGDLWPHCL